MHRHGAVVVDILMELVRKFFRPSGQFFAKHNRKMKTNADDATLIEPIELATAQGLVQAKSPGVQLCRGSDRGSSYSVHGDPTLGHMIHSALSLFFG